MHSHDAEVHVLPASLAGIRMADSIPDDESWQSIVKVLRRQHKAIHHAFATNQRLRAAQLLEEHINWFYSHTH